MYLSKLGDEGFLQDTKEAMDRLSVPRNETLIKKEGNLVFHFLFKHLTILFLWPSSTECNQMIRIICFQLQKLFSTCIFFFFFSILVDNCFICYLFSISLSLSLTSFFIQTFIIPFMLYCIYCVSICTRTHNPEA